METKKIHFLSIHRHCVNKYSRNFDNSLTANKQNHSTLSINRKTISLQTKQNKKILFFSHFKDKILYKFSLFRSTARPQSVQISSHPGQKKIEVKLGESQELTCVVRYAKPAAAITWYRGNTLIKGGDTTITPISIEDGEFGQFKE